MCQKPLDKITFKAFRSERISSSLKLMCHFRENRSSSKKRAKRELRHFIVPPFEGDVGGEILALHKFALGSYIQKRSAAT